MKIDIWPLIHNWYLFCFQKCSLSLKKNFFDPLRKVKKFQNIKIFNNIGSHDGLKKKIIKIGQNAVNPTFFCFTLYNLKTRVADPFVLVGTGSWRVR